MREREGLDLERQRPIPVTTTLGYREAIMENLKKKKDFIYLFLKAGEGREKGRETSMCGCLFCAPYWGPGPQPRHVP